MISEEMRAKLNRYGQAHILRFYEELNRSQKEILENQIAAIDFESMETVFGRSARSQAETPLQLEPIPCTVKASWTKEEQQTYRRKGLEILRAGKYAAVTMAGGQGTRLGHDGPKGTFQIRIPEEISLICDPMPQIKSQVGGMRQDDSLVHYDERRKRRRYKRFFQENDYFRYPREDIVFFRQFMLPMLDAGGNCFWKKNIKSKKARTGTAVFLKQCCSAASSRICGGAASNGFLPGESTMCSYALRIPLSLAFWRKTDMNSAENRFSKEMPMKKPAFSARRTENRT